jgi:glucose/arabinose dehydrogenase
MKEYTIATVLLFVLFVFGENIAQNAAKQSVKPTPSVSKLPKAVLKPIGKTVAKSVAPTVGFNTIATPLPLFTQPVKLKKGLSFNLNVPKDYHVSVAYEGLNRLRFLSVSPDGRLFATDMLNRSDNKKGKVLIFEDWNETTKSFKTVKTYLYNLHNGNQVAFFKDKGKDYIYVSETGKLTRYPYKAGDNAPTSRGEVIATFPDYGLSYKYGGWHLTRSLAFNDGKLYVGVGSSCNACVETEEVRATIIEMNPDGTDKKYYARGLRNSVAFKFVDGKMWATSMGRDLIGPDNPEDLFMSVERGGYYGFPFYYQKQGKIIEDTQFVKQLRPTKSKEIKVPPVAFCGFRAHSGPLGLDYLKEFNDPYLKNSFLVALHGSTSVWRDRGNAIVKVCGTNSYVEVVTGFLRKTNAKKTDADRMGRPCDVLMRDKDSFWVTDDLNGVLYLIWKK